MDAAQEALMRSQVGMLTYTVRVLVDSLGLLNTRTVGDPTITESLLELSASMARLSEAFPPPDAILH